MQTASPCCPRCGYDQSGVVAMWLETCPLLATCSECGAESASVAFYMREMLGPRWSLEHASRRFNRKWIETTLIAVRPGRMWSDLRPEHPVFRRRLLWMAVSWLALFHAVCGLMVGASWLLMASYGPGATPSWRWSLRDWSVWRTFFMKLAWPLGSDIEVPFSRNQTFSNPMHEFVMMSAVPLAFMGALTAVWVRAMTPRAERLGARHVERAMCLALPGIVAWTVIAVALFVAGGLLSGPTGPAAPMGVAFISLIAGYLAYMIWWWRCFAMRYAGRRQWSWVLLPLGVVAMALGWVCAVVADEVLIQR